MSEAISCTNDLKGVDLIRLFSDYLRVTGVAHTCPEPRGDPALRGKRLGIVNGSSWITLWSNYFGRRYLPGCHLINSGSEAVQVCFMGAHAAGQLGPPASNVAAFVRQARELVELASVNAVLLTCSTMNRAGGAVAKALAEYRVPVVQIDQPMMQKAVELGGRTLVVATHGPTVESTQALLRETAAAHGAALDMHGITIEEPWDRLAAGEVASHNALLAEAIAAELRHATYQSVVLAQLSMAALLLSHPDPTEEFGVPVLTSAECGFKRVREVLAGQKDQRL